MNASDDMIRLSGVSRRYFSDGRYRNVLDNVDFSIRPGTITGIRGTSGSGKTTLARILVGLDQSYTGRRILHPALAERKVQLVFQDSLLAFNPRLSLSLSLREALVMGEGIQWWTGDRHEVNLALESALTEVGLERHLLRRTPGRLSGGQRQRAAIARALLMKPAVLILDEPVAALDLSIQAKILNVLQRVHQDYEMTMVVISHDPHVLDHMCETVHTLEEGKLWSV